MLGQLDSSGKEHVIAFGGRSLSPCERKWSTSEQEMLAILEGIRAYRIYLSDKKFTIYTDHKALKYVMDQKRSTGRLARWAMEIQGYQFEIIHKPGKSNQVADALSRRHYEDEMHDPTIASIIANQSKSTDNQNDSSLSTSEPDSIEPVSVESTLVESNPEPTQVTLFYHKDDPNEGIFALEQEIDVSFQHPDLSNLSNLSKLQRECPDFKDIFAYLENGTLPDDEKSQTKVIQTSKYFDLCNGILYH